MMFNVSDVNVVLRRLLMQIIGRQADITKHVEYFRGRRGKLPFTSKEFKKYMENRFSAFSDNWCSTVAQAPVERIHFQGFITPDSSVAPDSLHRAWQDSDADRGLSEAALMMMVARRSYGLVTQMPDGHARITFENPDSCAMEFDPRTGVATVGLTLGGEGSDTGVLYFPDWYVLVRKNADKAFGSTGVESWAIDESTIQPNPLGAVPMVEFRNQCMLDRSPISDIEQVEAMQDTVNVLWAYLLNALDYASMPARVILGGERLQEGVYDTNGNLVGNRPADLEKQMMDRIYQITGSDVKIAEWQPANLDAFLPVIKKAVEHIAAETRTPSHYLLTSTEVPATGYEVAEAGLVNKILDRISYLRAGVKQLCWLAMLTEGDKSAALLVRNSTVKFANPQYRSESQMMDGLIKMRQAGFPFEYVAEYAGLSPRDVERVLAMREKEMSDPTLEKIAGQLKHDA